MVEFNYLLRTTRIIYFSKFVSLDGAVVVVNYNAIVFIFTKFVSYYTETEIAQYYSNNALTWLQYLKHMPTI